MKKTAHHYRPSIVIPYRILICCCIFITWIAVATYFHFFVIQNITCKLENMTACSEPVIAELSHLRGTLFFSPNIHKTLLKIQKNDPTIREITTTKQFPHDIVFSILTTPPMLVIKCPETFLLANKEGDLIENALQILPDEKTISAQNDLCSTLLNTRHVDPQIVESLTDFLEQTQSKFPGYTVEWLDSSTLLMKTSSQQRILLLIDQLQYQLDLYAYMDQQQVLPASWQELDLRFQKAIVR